MSNRANARVNNTRNVSEVKMLIIKGGVLLITCVREWWIVINLLMLCVVINSCSCAQSPQQPRELRVAGVNNNLEVCVLVMNTGVNAVCVSCVSVINEFIGARMCLVQLLITNAGACVGDIV